MLPFLPSFDVSKLKRLQLKVCRYAHHIINLNSYIRHRQVPKGLSVSPCITFPLNSTEQRKLEEYHKTPDLRYIKLALEAAKRLEKEAQANVLTYLDQARVSLPADQFATITSDLQRYAKEQKMLLDKKRTSKWQRDSLAMHAGTKRARGSRGGKKWKQKRAIAIQQTATTPTTVVNLSGIQLSQAENSLLSKGLGFCPSTEKLNKQQLARDCFQFYRRLRLRDFFFDRPSTFNSDSSALADTNLRCPSVWQPPKAARSPVLEGFIATFHKELQTATKTSTAVAGSSNMTWEETLALSQLSSRDDIVIKPADKGSAIVILSKTQYRAEVLRQLDDDKFYSKLNRDPTKQNNSDIKAKVTDLLHRDIINKKTASDLVEGHPKAASFYILPKIHKNLQNPPGRPIVSSNGCPTERISCYVDQILKPLVKTLPAYIQDTKDFLCQLQSIDPVGDDALLVTMDVVSLYSNIPHDDGLAACKEMLETRPTPQPPTSDVIDLAQLVLERNCFQFENQHYAQILGTAMGTRMAPSYANTFMGWLEAKLLATAPEGRTPKVYKRFIDDIFMLWLWGREALDSFIAHANELHATIKFTYEASRSVNFLDCTVSVSADGTLDTDLYTKPTDTHQYLLPSSNHPSFITRNIPYSLAIRICMIVSDSEKRKQRLSEMKHQLQCRGYSRGGVEAQIRKAERTHHHRECHLYWNGQNTYLTSDHSLNKCIHSYIVTHASAVSLKDNQ